MPNSGGLFDDRTIPDGSLVYRRITPVWYEVDPGTGERRLTSAAFSDRGGSMSVAIGIELDDEGHDPVELVADHPGYGLVALLVGELRSLGLGVVRSPTKGELCHGDVNGNKSKSTRKKLRDKAEQLWVLKPSPEAFNVPYSQASSADHKES